MEDHICHLIEMFKILRRYITEPEEVLLCCKNRKFLGYIVNHRGIEANPTKINTLLDMQSSRITKEVQSLNRRITTISRFVARTQINSIPSCLRE